MRLKGNPAYRLYKIPFTGSGNRQAIQWSSSAMTASRWNESAARNLLNTSPARRLVDAEATKDDLMVNAEVTYAPLAIWKDFHWTCTVTTFAPLTQDRLE